MFEVGSWSARPAIGGHAAAANGNQRRAKREEEFCRTAGAVDERDVSERNEPQCSPPPHVGGYRAGISLASDEEPHRHNQANKQGDYPQCIEGGEARRIFCVYWTDKGGDESAFVRVGSKYSFLHGQILA